MVTIGTQYVIRHPGEAPEVEVIPGLLRGWGPKGVAELISAISPTCNAVVYIEVIVDTAAGLLRAATATPTIYYKQSGSNSTEQVESLPASITEALSNLR
jgi:hypothetical protein